MDGPGIERREPDHRLLGHLVTRVEDLHDDRPAQLHRHWPDEWDAVHVRRGGHQRGGHRRSGYVEPGHAIDDAKRTAEPNGHSRQHLGHHLVVDPDVERWEPDYRLHRHRIAWVEDLHDLRPAQLHHHRADQRDGVHLLGGGQERQWQRSRRHHGAGHPGGAGCGPLRSADACGDGWQRAGDRDLGGTDLFGELANYRLHRDRIARLADLHHHWCAHLYGDRTDQWSDLRLRRGGDQLVWRRARWGLEPGDAERPAQRGAEPDRGGREREGGSVVDPTGLEWWQSDHELSRDRCSGWADVHLLGGRS